MSPTKKSLPPTNSLQDISTGRFRRALVALRRIGFGGVVNLIRQHGIRGSLQFVIRNIRHIVADRIARRWDRKYGVDTAGTVPLGSLSIVGPNKEYGNECLCTSPKTFDFMMRSLPEDLRGYTFIDIGSGKSRTLLLASRYNFSRIIGVEFAKELVACSKQNIASFKSEWQKCRDIEVVEADATQFVFPVTPLVAFFYNPFSSEIFKEVLNNIEVSLSQNERDCFIMYGSSSHNAIDWAKPTILSGGMFEEIPSSKAPFFLDAVRTVRFAIFKAS